MNDLIAISLSNIGVKYSQKKGFMRTSDFWALKDVSFDLMHGETLGVIGKNGVGKSSLLKVLAGVILPDRGEMKSHVHSVALLGLQVGLNSQLSGRDNAILNGMMMGLSKNEIEISIPEIINFTGLGEFIDQPVRNYSEGMRARLRFSIAIQSDPDVLLIDEVFGVGDIEFRRKSSEIIKARISSDKTVLIVSHDIETLNELCDRVVWIDQGETKMVGPTNQVIAKYVS